ncbi:hypothetical protein [Bythopirellula polymerisocia]|uniref:Uncharacterized protein n=1 Tax=Bythopirellula polymerisocia TaxID=2528003 RepID=A0A5C6D5F4_9BACT|nr:hypothetical protein [Bythopirellula polymerisocia]TWU30129.1 hypothetical protein Pla144_09150 [Bythopirellula polymerisocia]
MATKQDNTSDETIATENSPLAEQFVGQWNRLVSTTNWEKGRIICDWREALMTEGAAVTDYSDEAWAQLVGGVTSQHVGRLRRVSQRFGEEWDQYPGLFWSHFQAALDWDDAPMWLEGAIQNEWSVSQMRGKRWETLGTPETEQRQELEENSEFESPTTAPASAGLQEVASTDAPTASPKSTSVKSLATEEPTHNNQTEEDSIPAKDIEPAPAKPQAKRTRLNVDVELLPDDLADAFEQFKLAIIAQRREGWRDTTPEIVCECLDALRELALAEA